MCCGVFVSMRLESERIMAMSPYFIIGSPKAELLNVVEIVALRDIMAMMKYKRPRYKYRTKSTVLKIATGILDQF